MVFADRGKVYAAIEVKWSDRSVEDPREIRALLALDAGTRVVTTRTFRGTQSVRGSEVRWIPAAEFCYGVGGKLLEGRAGRLP